MDLAERRLAELECWKEAYAAVKKRIQELEEALAIYAAEDEWTSTAIGYIGVDSGSLFKDPDDVGIELELGEAIVFNREEPGWKVAQDALK